MSLIFPEESELVRGTAPGFRSLFSSFLASTFDSRLGSTRVQTFVGTCGLQMRNLKRGYNVIPPLPPQESTPQTELGSILLVVQNREPGTNI